MSDLEKYLKGEPLDDRLAALMKGEDEEELALSPELQAVFVPKGEIDDDDREHLKSLRVHAGWAVLLKLLDNDILRREDAMKLLSMSDPLSNPGQLAQGWADVGSAKRTRERMVNLLDEEVKKLGAKK